jgi:hypothetical protein
VSTDSQHTEWSPPHPPFDRPEPNRQLPTTTPQPALLTPKLPPPFPKTGFLSDEKSYKGQHFARIMAEEWGKHLHLLNLNGPSGKPEGVWCRRV